MSFLSVSFLFLFFLALALRGATRRSNRSYVFGLLLLSWAFYSWHVPKYFALILFSTCVDYFAARVIAAAPGSATARRKGILSLSLLLNLGLLGYFKYGGFVAQNIATSGLWQFVDPEIVLPIGISFYTFQSMSYTIDVYRGDIPAEKSFVRLACYIAFFPQLVAGPIVRARDFLYQLERDRGFRGRVFFEGAYLIVRGLFLKVVVADNLGRVVDTHWESAASETGGGLLALSMLAFFSCQLFCDFAGYTDIARGLAYQLGFRLPINFDAPYIAATFSDFWRRWHITLSRWFRDYLYIPLGGNRHGRARTLVNVTAVMVIAGLWHGASWTFVMWGALHGLALAIERTLGFSRGPQGRLASMGWYLVVQVTWILSMGLFRAEDLSQSTRVVGNAVAGIVSLVGGGLGSLDDLTVLGWYFVAPVVALHLRSAMIRSSGLGMKRFEMPIYAGAMLAAVLALYTTEQQFIYFQF